MNSFLTGEKVLLHSLEPTNLDLFHTWFTDREVTRYSLGIWLFPWSRQETELRLQQTLQNKEILTLAILEKTTGQLIGYGSNILFHNVKYTPIHLFQKDPWRNQ